MRTRLKGLRQTTFSCVACHETTTITCAYPTAPGKTCSLPVCGSHGKAVGKGMRYCPEHAKPRTKADQ